MFLFEMECLADLMLFKRRCEFRIILTIYAFSVLVSTAGKCPCNKSMVHFAASLGLWYLSLLADCINCPRISSWDVRLDCSERDLRRLFALGFTFVVWNGLPFEFIIGFACTVQFGLHALFELGFSFVWFKLLAH